LEKKFGVDYAASMFCWGDCDLFFGEKKIGVSRIKFDTTSRHIQRKLYKYLSPVVFGQGRPILSARSRTVGHFAAAHARR